MIRVELITLNLIMEAWVVHFTLQEAKTTLHCIGVVLCGDIDVDSDFCAFHLRLNFSPSFSYFDGFRGVQRLPLYFTDLIKITCPVVVGAAMKTVSVASLFW